MLAPHPSGVSPRELARLGAATFVALAALAAAATPARAEPVSAPSVATGAPDSDPDPDLPRLADGHAERTNYQPAGMPDRYGRGQVLVNAPIGVVRRLVLDYGHYRELTAGKFHTSRVIAKAPGGPRSTSSSRCSTE